LIRELDFPSTLALHDLAARSPAVAQQLAGCGALLAAQLCDAAFEVRRASAAHASSLGLRFRFPP
jgi:hypothetical protein